RSTPFSYSAVMATSMSTQPDVFCVMQNCMKLGQEPPKFAACSSGANCLRNHASS
ncbi:acyl-CoA dehydrogenase, N-terminal domain protein, partial [Vibrio parahaemolyticus V-223/04]